MNICMINVDKNDKISGGNVGFFLSGKGNHPPTTVQPFKGNWCYAKEVPPTDEPTAEPTHSPTDTPDPTSAPTAAYVPPVCPEVEGQYPGTPTSSMCYTMGDPHIRQFDGNTNDAMIDGDYVLYSGEFIQVVVRHYTNAHPMGVAGNNAVFITGDIIGEKQLE